MSNENKVSGEPPRSPLVESSKTLAEDDPASIMSHGPYRRRQSHR
jgi:hypothetical protein